MATLASFGKALKSKLESLGGSISDLTGAQNKAVIVPPKETRIDPGQAARTAQSLASGKTLIDTIKSTGKDVASKGLFDTYREAQQTYQAGPVENKSRAFDVVSGLAETPTNIVEGVSTLADSSKGKVQRLEGLTQAGLGGVGLLPGVAQFQGAYNLLLPQSTKGSVLSGVSAIQDTYSLGLQKSYGVNKENADSASRILWNVANILASVAGPKAGGKAQTATRSALLKPLGRKNAAIAGKTAGAIVDMAVQASPDILALAVDAAQNDTDVSKKDALLATVANNLGYAFTLPGAKKLSDFAVSKKADDAKQMTIDDAKSSTPEVIIKGPRDANNLITEARKREKKSFGMKPENGLKALLQAKSLYDEAGPSGYDPRDYDSLNRVIDNYKRNLGIDAKSSIPEVAIPKIEEVATVKENKATAAKSDLDNTAKSAVDEIKKSMYIGRLFLGDNDGVRVEVREEAGKIILDYIGSTTKDKGHGTTALNFIKEIADRYGVPIEGKIVAQKDSKLKVDDIKKLKAWYANRGFNVDKTGKIEYKPKGEIIQDVTPRTALDRQKSIQEITTPTITQEATVTPEGKAKDLDFAPIENGSMYKSDDTVNASVDKVLDQAFGNEGKFSLGLSRFAPATIAKAARNYSTGRFLNNILVRVGNTATQLGNFIDRGQRVMQNSYRDLIAKQAGLTDAKGIEKQDFTFNENDMIGKVSPEGIPVTKENVKTFRDTYRNIAFWERAIPGMNLDQTRNVVRAAYLYDFYKDSPETLNKYFDQEQQAYLKNLDESVETNIYGTFSPKAQKDGALGETVPLVEGYKHFDILQKNYERIPKKVRESIEIKDQNGTVYRFKNGLELQTFIKNAEKFGIKLDPKAINTLALDKKGPEIDPYRTHGSVARLLSYGDTMGKAYGDTYAVKTLDSLRDNAEGPVKTYVDSAFNGTFGGKGNKNIYEQFLGIADASPYAKAAQGIQRVGAGAALAFNPATYTQAIGTSAVRNLADSAKSIAENLAKTVGYGITGQGDKSLKSLALAGSDAARAVVGTARIIVPGLGRFTRGRDQQLVDTLTGEGFVTGYELFDGKGSEIVALSSGLSKENNAKAEIAIRGMQRVLNETGRLSAKDILSGKDLAEAWQKFKDEDPTGYKIASDQIYQDAKMVADVSRLSRLTTAGLYNATGGFKSYPLGLLSQIGSDIGTMGTYVLSKLKKEGLVSDKQAYGAASRIASYAASYKIAETAIRSMLGNDETDNEEEKKWKDKLAEVYTHRLVGNPQYTASELVQSLLSNVGIGKAGVLLEGVRLASQEYANNEDPERAKAMAMNRMYATMEQLLGGLGGASNIAETVNIARTGEATSFRDIVAGQLGTMSLDNTTGGGLATGEETTSVGEALLNALGYNKDKRLIDYMYGRLSEEQLKDIPDNLRPVAIWLKDTVRSWGRSGFPGAGYAADLVLGSNEYSTPIESRVQAQFAFEAAKNLKDARFDTLQEYLELNGIPKAWTPLIEQAMADRFSSVAGKYSKGRSAASGNNQVEENISEFFSPRVIDGKNFRERLIDVQTKNPKVFNDILNYIGKVAMVESQREVPIDLRNLAVTKTGKKEPLDPFAKEAWSKIDSISDSTSQTDNAIYDVFGGNPLKTAFTQSVVNSFKEFTKDMTTKGIGEALGNLDSVERITKFLLQNSESTNNYIDAISLGATELRTGLDDIRKYISADDFRSRYPFLTDALREGLSLRGEDVKINEAGPITSATTGSGGSGWGSGSGASSISPISSNLPTDLPGVGTKQKESKAIKLQSGKPPLRQIASLVSENQGQPSLPEVQVGLNQQLVRQGTTSLRQFGSMLK